MESRFIKILSVCLSLIFTASLIFFITGLVLEYKQSPIKTQNTLTAFVEETSKAAEYYLPGTNEFSDIMRSNVISNQNIAVVSIKQAGTTVFAYPISSEYMAVNKDGEPLITSESSLVSIKTISKELAGKPSIITVAIYNLEPSIIYSYTRIAFLFILGATLISGIALLYLYLSEQSLKEEYSYDEPYEFEIETDEYNHREEQKPDYDISIPDSEPIQPITSIEPVAENEKQDDFFAEIIAPDEKASDEIIEEVNICSTETVIEETDNKFENEEEKEPSGLFSPVTGFGWESYLENRLDSELVRSASSEEDIALIIVRINDLDRTSEIADRIFNQFLDMFKYRDLIFEYKQDGFSCILQNSNIEKAITFAEQLYAKISNTIKEAECNNQIGIGISTRSFRLIPGKRLFTEAEQALEHAFEDKETAIVAFKVDPSKYRQYIAESTQN